MKKSQIRGFDSGDTMQMVGTSTYICETKHIYISWRYIPHIIPIPILQSLSFYLRVLTRRFTRTHIAPSVLH